MSNSEGSTSNSRIVHIMTAQDAGKKIQTKNDSEVERRMVDIDDENTTTIESDTIGLVGDESNTSTAFIIPAGKNQDNENNVSENNKLDKDLEEYDIATINANVQKLKDLATKYEESAKKIKEASTYCTAKELSVLGIGLEDRITECANNYLEIATKLREYANSLEANLQNKKKN